ncbi:MAG TPA: hypothetical protein VK548_17275 [Candidatus Acidoferrum sp.]|nr:hypothetical protein [Candidatus Acidoferrum sp.]
MKWLIAVMLLAFAPALAHAQDAKRPAAERSSAPNYGTAPDAGTGPGGQEIRPGSPDGDSPSASAGRIARDPVERRILGLPMTAVLVIAAVILGLVALAGVVVPSARRRSRARGNGTYGR